MAFLDDDGNRVSSYTPPPSPTPTPNAGAATNPIQSLIPSPTIMPSSLAPPTVPTYQTTNPMSVQQFNDAIINSPQYKQQMENIDRYQKQAEQQAAFDAEWAQKFYAQNAAQVAGSFTPAFVGTYGAGEAQQAQLDALQKEKAAHDLANQQEYTREALASRGLGSSGQNAVDQGELTYSYDTLLKDIDIRAAARAAQLAETRANAAGSAAASNANQQRSIQNQLADLALRQQYTVAQAQQAQAQLALQIASKRGDALFQVADQLMPFYFDSATGAYIGPGGQVLTPEQAQQTIAPTQPAAPYNPGPSPTPIPVAQGGPTAGSNAYGNAFIR